MVDKQMHKSICDIIEMKNNDPSMIEYLCLTFSTMTEEFGQKVTHELKPGGGEMDVTADNIDEYIRCMLKHIMIDRVDNQLTHFLNGFYEAVPQPLLCIFDAQELELLLCGLPHLDIDDWRRNTEYRGKYQSKKANHKVVKWFWEVVKNDLTDEQRARLMQFTTGTSRVPVQGFSHLTSYDGKLHKFTLHGISVSASTYPRAHTCFNKIDLPEYSSKRELKEKLTEAIMQPITGFGME
jgi:E3 ubiquitin-protein ligase NEDD4